MAEGYRMLLAEFDRVVNSPYPTQLKSLRDIVCDKASLADISRCIELRSCQVNRLAANIIEALPQWPYVLDILTRLATCVPARDALLRAAPTLLHDVLEQATRADISPARYTSAAITLLSHPLPDACTLPAGAQTLFLRLIEDASASPCATSIRPVHAVLKGTGTLLLGLLSNGTLVHLEERLADILRSNHNRPTHEAGDQLLTLHCLAIMHLFASEAEALPSLSNSFYETQELLASTQPTPSAWSPAEMQKYFINPTKAPKTIQLVVLQTMWACQTSSAVFDDRADTLVLANALIGAIPEEIRDTWCSNNGPLVQKLQQKALACSGQSELQFQAFGFICQLCKPIFLQGGVVQGIRHAIQGLRMPLYAAKNEAGDMMWHCMSAAMDQETVSNFLQTLASVLVNESSEVAVENAAAYGLALQQLSRLTQETNVVLEAALGFLAVPASQQVLNGLVNLARRSGSNTQASNDRAATCPSVVKAAYNKVLHELSSCLLHCALQAPSTEHAIPIATTTRLLDLHAASAIPPPDCEHTRLHGQTMHCRMEFAEQESTLFEHPADWRAALQSHFTTEAKANESALTRIFAQACQDLEARCEGVEQPLHDEQAVKARLQEQYDELQAAYGTLEAQTIDRKLHYDALEVEIADRMRELDAAREEASGLLQQASLLEEELQRARDEGEEKREEMNAERERAELEYATTLAAKTAELEDLQETRQCDKQALRDRDGELETLRSELAEVEQSRGLLQSETENLQDELRRATADLEARSQELGHLAGKIPVIERELHSVRAELDRAVQHHESEVQRMQETMKQNAEAANRSHNHAIDSMAAQHGEEVAGLERQLSDLDKEVKRLRRKCDQKDRQISEANAMRTNLLAALGGGPAVPQTQFSLPHRTRSSTRTQPDESQVPTPSSAVGEDTEIFDGRASFASNASSGQTQHGPTPKRAKPRKSFKAASPAKPRASMSTRTARASLNAKSTTKRRPLGSLNANQLSPRKETDEPKTPSKGSQVKGGDDSDGSTFDENELFGSRSGAKMKDLEAMLEQDTQG